MMTGRKPESLIDKSTMTWKWHQWVPTLTPWFAKILNKMLSRVPNSRYQSATEVAQALRAVSDFVGAAAPTDIPAGHFVPSPSSTRPTASLDRPSATNSRDSVPLSRVKRSPAARSGSSATPRQRQQNPLRGILNTPWGIGLGSAVAAIIFIIIPIVLLSRSLTTPSSGTKTTPQPTPTAAVLPQTPLDPIAPSAAPEAPPTAPAPPVATAAETLSVEAGKPLIKEGTLSSAQPTVFSLTLPVGHKLKATLSSTPAGATMNILAPNQANVDVFAKNTINWEGTLPLAGEYRIEIVPLTGVSIATYKLEVITSAPIPVGLPVTAPSNAVR